MFETIRLRGDYGEYCIDLLGRAIRSGYNVVEVPYVCVPRTAGDSKTGENLLDYLAKGRKYVSAAVAGISRRWLVDECFLKWSIDNVQLSIVN